MVFRTVLSMLLVALLLITPISVNAAEKGDKLNLKVKQTKELERNGTIKKIEKKIKDYYKNNYVIDDSKINDLNSPEAKEFIKSVEDDMRRFGNKIKSKSDSSGNIGTLSMGDDEPTGSNSINYSAFENADIILVHDGGCSYGYYRHAGTYDEARGEFISAQISDQGNGEGVIWEDKSWYRGNYDEAAGVWVADYDNEMRTEVRNSIVDYLDDQIGDSYSFTWYYDRDNWYCSKLPWVGWEDHYLCDLNEDGGFCVPDDLNDSQDTSIFVSAS